MSSAGSLPLNAQELFRLADAGVFANPTSQANGLVSKHCHTHTALGLTKQRSRSHLRWPSTGRMGPTPTPPPAHARTKRTCVVNPGNCILQVQCTTPPALTPAAATTPLTGAARSNRHAQTTPPDKQPRCKLHATGHWPPQRTMTSAHRRLKLQQAQRLARVLPLKQQRLKVPAVHLRAGRCRSRCGKRVGNRARQRLPDAAVHLCSRNRQAGSWLRPCGGKSSLGCIGCSMQRGGGRVCAELNRAIAVHAR